jgi:hypothetical protein
MPFTAKSRGFVLVLLFVAALVASACSAGAGTGGDGVRPSATAPVSIRMAQVRTATPTSDVAATRAAKPTATWVPLITPSPTPEGGAPSKADVPRISVVAAKEKVEAGEAILVDVRSPATYEQSHIAGAISMTSSQVARQFTELPTDKLIVFY